MAPLTYDYEVTSSIPPARLFNAFILDHNLIPKVLPQAIKSVKIVQGDGGVGTIKLVNFGKGSQYKSAKHIFDGLDKDNFIYSYIVTESDAFSDMIEKVAYVVKIEASADGGSICKTSSTYHTKGEIELTEERLEGGKEKVKAGKQKALSMFKAMGAYLLANPDAYN